MCSDVDTRVGTPHMKMCSGVQSRVGTPHIKMCSDDHTRVGTPHRILRKSLALLVAEAMWWVGRLRRLWGGWGVGGPSQEIIPLRGSILQADACQILSLAENPRWSPSVAIFGTFKFPLFWTFWPKGWNTFSTIEYLGPHSWFWKSKGQTRENSNHHRFQYFCIKPNFQGKTRLRSKVLSLRRLLTLKYDFEE